MCVVLRFKTTLCPAFAWHGGIIKYEKPEDAAHLPLSNVVAIRESNISSESGRGPRRIIAFFNIRYLNLKNLKCLNFVCKVRGYAVKCAEKMAKQDNCLRKN